MEFDSSRFGKGKTFERKLVLYSAGILIVAITLIVLGALLGKSNTVLSIILISVGASAIGGLLVDVTARLISHA